jgi:hypothetical protein
MLPLLALAIKSNAVLDSRSNPLKVLLTIVKIKNSNLLGLLGPKKALRISGSFVL